MILHIENTKKISLKLLELMNKYSQVVAYKIDI